MAAWHLSTQPHRHAKFRMTQCLHLYLVFSARAMPCYMCYPLDHLPHPPLMTPDHGLSMCNSNLGWDNTCHTPAGGQDEGSGDLKPHP